MKSLLKIGNMKTVDDVNNIRQAISSNEGVVACQINKEKQEVNIVYDNLFLSLEDIIESIENLGYTVI